MPFVALLWFCTLTYFLTNFLLLPLARKRWQADRKATKIGKAGAIAIVEFARNTALLATLTYGTLAVITSITGYGWGENATVLQAVIEFAKFTSEIIQKLKGIGDNVAFWIVVLLVCFIVVRRLRSRMMKHYERQLLEELQKLHRERTSDPQAW